MQNDDQPSTDNPQAFLSYTRDDDQYLKSGISWLRQELQDAIEAMYGDSFKIFQDVEDIQAGDRWSRRLGQALHSAQFFIPILTPRFFKSRYCREETLAFRKFEAMKGRDDLIIPIYMIEYGAFTNPAVSDKDQLITMLSQTEPSDWRGLRSELRDISASSQNATPAVQSQIDALAKVIVNALEYKAPLESPNQRSSNDSIRHSELHEDASRFDILETESASQDNEDAINLSYASMIGIGGSLTAPPLPHHLAYGSRTKAVRSG